MGEHDFDDWLHEPMQRSWIASVQKPTMNLEIGDVTEGSFATIHPLTLS